MYVSRSWEDIKFLLLEYTLYVQVNVQRKCILSYIKLLPNVPISLEVDQMEVLAEDICTSIGSVGHNIEYLFRLSDFMRRYLPDKEDDHLYTLDRLVRERLGLSTVDNLTWKELLLLPDFKRIVRPLDYKAKWKQAIRESMSKQQTIDRWSVLLTKIKSMIKRASEIMEKVDDCEFVDIEIEGVDNEVETK